MMRSCFNLVLLTLSLYASLVQTAPSAAVMTIYRIDQGAVPGSSIVSRKYAVAEKQIFVPKMELQMIPEQLEQNDVTTMRMHFLQLNLLKILIILDVIILICVFYSMKSD